MNKMIGVDACKPGTGMSDSRATATVISDNGRVRVGAVSPAFPPAKPGNASKVRMGAVSPAFPSAQPSNTSKVRMGAVSPAFPVRRT